jgi:predicted MPP superfamily phosphohydrolase
MAPPYLPLAGNAARPFRLAPPVRPGYAFPPVSLVLHLVFMHFWSFLALAAAGAQWALWCALVGPPASPIWHVLVPPALAIFNRLAAEACDTERHRAPILGRAGALTLAIGFGSTVAALGVAALWVLFGLRRLMAAPAVAGPLLATPAGSEGSGFDLAARLLVVATGLVMAYGYAYGHRRLRVRERTVPLPGVTGAVDGYRLVHLSDLHLGPLADRQAVRAVFDRVNALEADLICITGDIIDNPKADLESWLPELCRLRARHGVVAILGNHDRYADADRVAAAIRRLTPLRLLRDEVLEVDCDGTPLFVIGLEDHWPPRTDRVLPRLATAVPEGAPVVVLAHHPDAFDDAVAAGLPLTFAGHTHGGQLAVPGLRHLNVARILVGGRDVGWFRSEGHRLHVSAGLGVSGQRIRIGVPRDVTVVRLASPGRPADSTLTAGGPLR